MSTFLQKPQCQQFIYIFQLGSFELLTLPLFQQLLLLLFRGQALICRFWEEMQPGECAKLNYRCSEPTSVPNAANLFKFMTLNEKQEANEAFGMKLVLS